MEEFTYIIEIANKEGVIQEIGGRRKFSLPYSNGEIIPYQMKVLEEGLCNCLLEARFIKEEDKMWMFYDFSGFIQFKDYINQCISESKCIAKEIIDILSSISQCVLEAENQLLPSETFSLNPNTVFINPDTKKVKLAFVPVISNSLQENMIELISFTEEISKDDQWKAYGEIIRDEIFLKNYGLSEMVKCFGEKSREIFNRQWPVKSLDRGVVEENLVEKVEEIGSVKKYWPFK